MFNNIKQQKGFSALYVSLIVMFATLAIGVNIFFMSSNLKQLVTSSLISLQSLYAAESSVEDALLRVTKGMSFTNPFSLFIGEAEGTATISNLVGGSRTIAATGDLKGAIKKINAVYAIEGVTPSFFYGAHIGEGGLVMDNLSRVLGNVFSNGTIQGSSGAQITGSAIVANQGNRLQDVSVGQDAKADSCQNSSVTGTLTATSQTGCTFGSFAVLQNSIAPVPLAIHQANIDQWKQEALAGGIISGDYALSGSQTATLGPKKIEGNLTVSNFAVLTISGVLWVTGNIEIKNSAKVQLVASYGNLSGVVVGDGSITLQNNSISSGSGQAGSYLLYVSTSVLDEAILTKNNAVADLLFTIQGGIVVENNVQLREVTGFKIHLKNSATITYEAGLQDAAFVSGPGGGWNVTSWKEVE